MGHRRLRVRRPCAAVRESTRQVSELAADGIDAKEKVVSGPTLSDAANMIADVARESGADLIVVGTRGHTPLAGLLLGSVTERLLHLGPCPILAVPTTPSATDAQQPAAATASA